MTYRIDLPTRMVNAISRRLEKLKATVSLTNLGAYSQDASISLLELQIDADLGTLEAWLDRATSNMTIYDVLAVTQVA